MSTCHQGGIGSLNFGGIFFQGAPKKKICCQNRIADQKRLPIALGAPILKGPVGFFPPRYMANPPLPVTVGERSIFTISIEKAIAFLSTVSTVSTVIQRLTMIITGIKTNHSMKKRTSANCTFYS
jgi:hypothetical protein